MKYTKKVLSVLMSLMMGFTVMTTPILAESPSDQEPTGEPEVTETEKQDAEEMTEAPEEETKETETPEVSEEPAEEPEVAEEPEETIQSEEAPEAEEGETEKTEEPEVVEEESETKAEKDTTSLTATYEGVTVTVEFESDTFGGKNVNLVVGEAGKTEEEALKELGREYKAVDISFVDEEGNKVPVSEGEQVSVTLKAVGMKGAGKYDVYHVDADGIIESIKAKTETSNEKTENVKVGETTKTVNVPAETKTVTVKDYKTEKYTAYETKTKKVKVPAKYGYRYILKYKKNGKKVKASIANPILKKAKKDKNGKPKVSGKKYKVVKEKYLVKKAYTKTVTEKVPVTKTRKVQSGTHKETQVIKEAYSYEVKEDVYEDVVFSDVEAKFAANSFSVYAVVWKDSSGAEAGSAKIHWGYLDGDTFTEFTDTASLDSDAASMSLDVIFDGYMYNNAVYEKDSTEYVLSSDTLTKVTGNDGATTWTMTVSVPTGQEETPYVDQTVTIEDGADIYAYYVKKDASYTPPGPSPQDIQGPKTVKTVTSNGDGTYKIRLDVTGRQEHTVNKIGANVIIVMDRTQSMSNSMSGGGNRMDAAREALSTLITTLNPGSGENQNLINLTVVEFANRAAYYDGLAWTQSRTDMENYVSNLRYIGSYPEGYGTPWQTGLYGGRVRANEAVTNEDLKKNKTYVIFVTDGDPNAYYTRPALDGGPSNESRYIPPTGSGAYVPDAYTAAIPNAVNLSTTVEHRFYGVYCGNANDSGKGHLQDLMSVRYQGSSVNGTFIDGTSKDQIKNAFQGIAETIVSELGSSEVGVDDGVPTLANVSAAVSGSAGGFSYYIKPKNGTETVWEDAPSAGYSSSNGVTWDLSGEGVLVDGTTYSLEFTVWPTQEAYDLLANLNNDMEGYKLNQLDDATLEQLVVTVGGENYYYTEGQTAGTGTWAPHGSTTSYTTAQFMNVIESASAVEYNVLTNTHLLTTYKYGESTYSDPPENGLVSGAMLLEDKTITVKKVWHNDLDNREAHNLTLTVTKDNAPYIPIEMGEPVSTGANQWEQNPVDTLYISCGVMTVSGDTLNVREPGHDYSVIEPEDYAYYWDLTADVYHPMVVNGTNTMMILVTEKYLDELEDETAKAAIKSLENNKRKTISGKDYYKFNDKTYVVTDGSNVLLAENDRRSNLFISKTVEGTGANKDDLFGYKITMDNEKAPHPGDENYSDHLYGMWFFISTAENDRDTMITEGITVDGATPEMKEGQPTGFYWIHNGGEFTVYLKDGWFLNFTSVIKGTDYTIEELGEEEMPEGYTFKKVETSADNKQAGETSTPAVPDEKNPMKVIGSIDKSNTDYKVDYTNKYDGYFYIYHSGNNTVERIPIAVNGEKITTYDIYAKTLKNTLYGGYYSAYANADPDESWVDDFGTAAIYTDTNATGDKWYHGKKTDDWNGELAYSTDGQDMGQPVKDETYYLKEVPLWYLKPYTHFTYLKPSNKINYMWFMSGIDDPNYTGFGYKIKVTKSDGTTTETMQQADKAVKSLTITNSGSSAKYTAKMVFEQYGMLKDAYLAYYRDSMNGKYVQAGNTLEIQQYWKTPDGIIVFGDTTRTITIGEGIVGTDLEFSDERKTGE